MISLTRAAPLSGQTNDYFTPIASGLPAMLDAKACWADTDSDGLPDAVLGGYAGFDLPVERIYRNLGNNTFADSNAGLSAQDRSQTFWGDFDRDGYLDVAISGSTNSLYRNNGDGTFTTVPNALPRFFSSGAAAWGDYDNDGDLDIVTLGSDVGGSTTRVMRNNGDGTFTEVPAGLAPGYAGSLDWGDYDNDGDLDLLLTGYWSTMMTKLYSNDGTGVFTEVPIGAIPVYYGSAKWGDYDNDGYLDILLTGGNGDVTPVSRVYHNNANGTFTDINANLMGVTVSSSAWGDFDNDGYLDVILSGRSTNASFTGLYRNNHDQTFTLVNAGLTNVQFGSAAWADSDLDGDLDLLLVGYGANWANPTTQLYRNNAPSNSPPAAPTSNVTTITTNGEVIFTWSKPLDAQTPSAGLVYNLRVGTTPGGSEIMTPQASASGLRRLPQSTGMHTNRWRLRNLPKGTYYWSVQAIDTAYAGSPFATEQSFTITNTAPAVTVATEVRSGPSLAGSVPFGVSDAESVATQITVTAQSLDGAFIPPGGVSIQGTGAARTLSFKVGVGQIGTNYIVLRATDPGGLTTDTPVRVVSEWFTSIPFSASTNFYELNEVHVAWGYPGANPALDIDRDGDLDVLMHGSVWSNNYIIPVLVIASNGGFGDFSFNIVSNYPASGGGYGYWLDDYNRDGKVDLLATGDPYNAPSQIWAGDGAGGFALPQDISTGAISIFADLDNDGDLDGLEFVPSSSGQTTLLVYYQNVRGQLRPQPGPPLMSFMTYYQEAGPVRAADIDGDGDVDIVLPGQGTNSNQRLVIRLLRNPGRGPFSFEYYPILGPATLYGVSPYDWDDDFDLDCRFQYATSYSGPIVPGYAANDGSGHFHFGDTNNLVPSALGWDFDNDGDLDRVVSELVSTTPTIKSVNRLYLKTGPNQYSPQPFTMTQPQFVGDFDGDGDLDYLQRSEEKDPWDRVVSPMQWRLFRNNNDHTNRPPAAPAGLTATQQPDDRVRLAWNAAADDHTPAAALTYNLRLGTTPGGVDIVAPCSDPNTGRRWLVAEGNTGRLRFRDVNGLPPGRYYWSVQAVDGVFVAGSWAPERSFAINRPTISPLADIVTPPGVTSVPISFTVTGGSSPVNALVLTAVPDDPTLIPTNGIVFAGTGTERTLTLTPVARSGDTDLTVIATDQAGFSAIVRCHLRVAWWDPVALDQIGIQRFEKWYFLDADLDGWLDFFGYTPVGTSAPQLFSFHNRGDGTFELVTNNLPGSSSDPVELGGFGNDNVADVLTLQHPATETSLFRVWQGTGNGFDFVPLTEVSNRSAVTTYKWLDLDNDGCRDLVHFGWIMPVPTNAPTRGLFVAHGKPDGTFDYYPQHIGMYWGAALAAADFDRDGDLDLAVSGTDFAANGQDAGANFTRLYLNQGSGNFTPVSAGLPQTDSWKLSIADFDSDGWPDVLLLPRNASTTQAPRLMRNVGGTFVQVPTSLPPELDLISWGDFDNDGDPDLVAAYSSDYPSGAEDPYLVTIFRNDGGVLNRADTGLPWMLAHQADFADTDNDGDLDLLISGEAGWNLTGRLVCRNTCTHPNTTPSAPVSLTTGRGGEFAMLQWTPAPDAESGTALTFNVRIGTTPGGSEVMSAVADPASGRRRLTGIGNVGYAPRWRLAPPDGTYYWSVQAVDVGYAASAFAPETSFTYYHPTISTFTNMVRYPGTGLAAQPLTIGDTDSDANSLTLSALSSNPALIPITNITFSGSGSNRTVSILPAPGAGGVTFVSVIVTDVTGLSATNSFRFEVTYFTDLAPTLPGANGTPAFADFNNDGLLDLCLAGSIYRNNGGLNFTAVATVAAGQRHGVAWGDYDRDGDLDLAVAGSGPTKLYRNDGGGVFADSGAVVPAAGNAGIAWGDFDNDGDLDLLNLGDGMIYRNDGPKGFVGVSVGLPALGESSAAFGDYDNDGDADLLVSGFQGPSTFFTAIYRNDGGAFAGITNLYGLRGSSVAWGDYDNDGYLDALTAGYNDYAYQVRVYHNNRDGTFTDINLALPGVAYGHAQWLDFDNDGSLDIFLCGAIGSYPNLDYATRIYRNNRDGTFSDVQGGLPKSTLASWGDLDGDSDLDLILSGETIASYRLLENRCPYTNTPPLAPAGLLATLLPDNNVLLAWAPASDLETTNVALSYALRAGSAPGGVDLIAPPARSDTGARRLAERGPLNSLFWLVRDVPHGTWHWSVQAVDHSFAGSAFAPEGTFTITNARPLISTIPNQLTVPGRATPPLPFTVSDLETPPSNLVVAAWSSNTNLVPPASLPLSGAGTNRTVTVQPSDNLSGTATIFLVVTDAGGLTATSRFDVVVQMFTDATAGLPASIVGASAWGDYDNDGDLDIALAGSGVSYASIYRNNSGVFSNQNFTLPNRTENEIAWLDFDRDGDLDLMESGWNGGYVPVTYFFRNNGTNTFTSSVIGGVTNVADGTMSWADFDNDGDPDLLLSGDPNTYHTPDGFTRLYRNNGGVFADTGVILPQLVKSASAWADIDNDGDLDLLLAGQTGATAATAFTGLFRNDGNGVFTQIPTPLPAITQGAMAFGDYDNDGAADILMSGLGTNSSLVARIYHNNGSGVFTDSGAALSGVFLASVAWGDYDNDGFLDALIAGTTKDQSSGTQTRVSHNNGNGTFTALSAILPGIASHNSTWGDYDNDGDLDLLLGSRVYRNNWNLPNTPPTAPTNLLAQITSDVEVRFSWSPATDLQTTNSHGLSYNLRLGTSPGGAQVMAPQSDTATGYRRVPLSGNAGATNFWRVTGLTNGTYYWSVQAVDPSLAGSPFAAESTLVISRPVISGLTNRSTLPNSIVGPIAFTVSDAETAASNLVVTVSSSDTNVVPAGGLLLGGADMNRTLTITPATNRCGMVTITVFAADESGQVGSRSFLLTVERFADIAAGLPGFAAPVAWGDYDGDGYLDLVLRNSLLRNHGAGAFTSVATLPAAVEGSANWGDYDNDSDLDLLVTGSNASRILRNQGDGTFVDMVAGLAAPSTPGASAWGDFDNDGDLDVVIAGVSSRIYRNQTNTAFTDIGAGLTALANGSVAWGDYDKDGDLDLLMAGANSLRIYRNNGNGTFTDILANLPGVYVASVAWGDFNNDGNLDFVVVGSTNNAPSGVVARLYRNTTNTTASLSFTNIYAVPSQGPVGVWRGAAAWGDYDNDGDLDLLITGESTNAAPLTRLYRNDGGSFVDSGWSLPNLKASFAAWGDFDNDGNLDVALSGYRADSPAVAYICRNFGSPGLTNSTPAAPAGLTAVVTGKSVRLSWTAATDPNQTNALTYNLRVGTAPGLGNIMSPMAGADGTRRLSALGNTQYRQSRTVTNLIGGAYFWSVQAVDHAFAGSAFATEQTFTISNRPPTVIDRWFTCAENSSIIMALSGSDPDNDSLTTIILTQPLFGTVSGTWPNITYRPRSHFFGFDEFTYFVHDRTTNSQPATVFMTVTPVEDAAIPALGIQPLPANETQLSLQAEPWRTWQIQVSEDLIHWRALTNLLATNLLSQWVDHDASLYPRRFYRAAACQIRPFIHDPLLGGPACQFWVEGEPGRNYRIQVSTNLVTWTSLRHLLMTNTTTLLTDPDAGQFRARFYRIQALP